MTKYRNHNRELNSIPESNHLGDNYTLNPRIIILDNGSYTIKVGHAGCSVPEFIIPNCSAQPIKSKMSGNQSVSSQKSDNVYNNSNHNDSQFPAVRGSDIASLQEYFCCKPFEHALLMDSKLELSIWEILFSKEYMNIPDPESYSLLVTEHYNSPASSRHILTQIVFEEFQFDRMIISPSQQLVSYAYDIGSSFIFSHPYDSFINESSVERRLKHSSIFYNKKLKMNSQNNDTKVNSSSVDYWIIGDSPELVSDSNKQCQVVVDIGHQSIWVIPSYLNIPLETAVMRIDIGGYHIAEALSVFLFNKGLEFPRNELLLHHMKEESCFLSMNFMSDLKLARSLLPHPTANGIDHVTHLTHLYKLPTYHNDLSRKADVVNFFDQWRDVHYPKYKYSEEDNVSLFEPIDTSESNKNYLETLLKEKLDSNQMYGNHGSETKNPVSKKKKNLSDKIYYLDNERISVPELLFRPADFKYILPPQPTYTSSYKRNADKINVNPRLLPPLPYNQCGVVEAIEKSIYSSPPFLQPKLASYILLCGGCAAFKNLPERLYMELRATLPEHWPINIYVKENPSITSWQGGSAWASIHNNINYNTYCLTRTQYNETGYESLAQNHMVEGQTPLLRKRQLLDILENATTSKEKNRAFKDLKKFEPFPKHDLDDEADIKNMKAKEYHRVQGFLCDKVKQSKIKITWYTSRGVKHLCNACYTTLYNNPPAQQHAHTLFKAVKSLSRRCY